MSNHRLNYGKLCPALRNLDPEAKIEVDPSRETVAYDYCGASGEVMEVKAVIKGDRMLTKNPSVLISCDGCVLQSDGFRGRRIIRER